MSLFKSLNLPVKLAISLSILAILAVRINQKDDAIMSNILAHFHASAWLYATLLMLVQLVLLSARWQMLLNLGKRYLTFLQALQINLTSQLANLVLITSIGGMVARIALSAQHGATIFKSLIATIFDRLMTLSALLVLSAAFLPNLWHYVDNQTFHTLSVYIGVFTVMMFLLAPLFLNLVVFRLPQTARLKGRYRYGLRYLRVLINNPVLCAKLALFSLAAQGAFFLAVYALVNSSGASIDFWQMMIVLPVISLVAALPISIGGWGVREGAYVYGLGLLGVPLETAFLISVQVGLVSMLTTMLGGIPSLMTSNFNRESFRLTNRKLADIKQRL